jgi:5-hydroxyisourate hydrolase
MGISTHILDTATGRPATGVVLQLSQNTGNTWHIIGHGKTDDDGRCTDLLGEGAFVDATYKIHFATAEYYSSQNATGLYPYVEIVFTVTDPSRHYHIPLLLTANGYTTYRGS